VAKAGRDKSSSGGIGMAGLLALSRAIDRLNAWLGRWLAWLIVVAVLISSVNAIVRKLADTSSNAWLELQWVLFGVVFLLCSPWTLLSNEHIRIDIVSNLLSKRVRDVIDVIGHLFFLMPVCIVMLYTSVPFFWNSFRIQELSANAGGLILWPSKLLVPLGFGLLLIQGISELIKRIAIMNGSLAETSSGGGHHAAAEAEAQRLKEALEEEARRHEAETAANKAKSAT
jgi:TRAP-type mannitol/chloroaromatic compound transport system permease small subunit